MGIYGEPVITMVKDSDQTVAIDVHQLADLARVDGADRVTNVGKDVDAASAALDVSDHRHRQVATAPREGWLRCLVGGLLQGLFAKINSHIEVTLPALNQQLVYPLPVRLADAFDETLTLIAQGSCLVPASEGLTSSLKQEATFSGDLPFPPSLFA